MRVILGGMPLAFPPPPGYHTITPRMVVLDVMAEVEFLRVVFGATGLATIGRPAEMRIGDSLVMVTPATAREVFPAFLYVYVEDTDAAYGRAVAAGATTLEAPLDTPYGDRRAMVRDPLGNVFQIAHRPAVASPRATGWGSRGRILLVSGSLRGGSTNTALLRTARSVAPGGIEAVLYDGQDGLPHFDPDREVVPRPAAVEELRAAVRGAVAVVFCTPEYAGALPGSFKNLLDWTIGDDRPGSIYQKPVAWINASAAPTGAADAHDSLAKVLAYAHADVVENACATIPVTRQLVGEDGLIRDPLIRSRVVEVLRTLNAHAGRRGGDT